MLPRDERRFKTADLDGDLAATREEFTAFLHPEEFEHMKDIVVLVSRAKPNDMIFTSYFFGWALKCFSNLSAQGLERDAHIIAKWGMERDAFHEIHLI